MKSSDALPEVDLPAIAILGTGSMGGAILSGLRQPHVTVQNGVRVTTRSAASAAKLHATGVHAESLEENPNANKEAAAAADIVLLAVKPAQITDLLDEIADSLVTGTVVVSVAGGVTTESMEAHVPENIAVVRTMPNTPATVGLAVTGVTAGSHASEMDVNLVQRMFGTVGDVVVVPEEKMDALGAIAGSGPAYVFYVIEQFERIAREHGFTPEQAKALVQGTFAGSVELLDSVPDGPVELRRQVTSPKGSTERAIAVFDEAGLPGILTDAIDAAISRSREMGQGK